MTLTIDLETIPTQKAGAKDLLRATVQPPGNITKQESIDKWMAENAEDKAEELYRKTSFDGTQGEIVCIGWAINDDPALCLYRDYRTQSEAVLLANWFAYITAMPATLVGHNALGFDLRFLFQRAVINRVKPSFPLQQDSRYTGGAVFDTMLAWAGWGNRVKLTTVCDALGIPVKTGGIDGSQVWDACQEGRIQEVADYCKEDVEATREVYKRMTFQEVLS